MTFHEAISSKKDGRFCKAIKYIGKVRNLLYEERLPLVFHTQTGYV